MSYSRFDESNPAIRKIRNIERYYGLDKVSDAVLFKIAAHVVPPGGYIPDRLHAVSLILRHKLPFPVNEPAPVDKKPK